MRQSLNRFDSFGVCEMTCTDPARNRHRYYCIAIQPGLFEVSLQRRWGRIGRQPRVKDEFCEDIGEAIKRANQIWRQKRRKGYEESGDRKVLI